MTVTVTVTVTLTVTVTVTVTVTLSLSLTCGVGGREGAAEHDVGLDEPVEQRVPPRDDYPQRRHLIRAIGQWGS